MKLIIKKFNIKHEGTLYGPGDVIEVETDVAEALMATGNVAVYVELPTAALKETKAPAKQKESKTVQSAVEEKMVLANAAAPIVDQRQEETAATGNDNEGEQAEPEQLPDINLGATVKAVVPKAAAVKNKPRPNTKAGSKK